MKRFVLASASPRRKDLLAAAGYEFTVLPSDADETLPASCGAEEAVKLLAERKALSVVPLVPGTVVLGCDTVVAIGNEILGKPETADEAAAMLRRLSGKVHTVYSGVCVSDGTRTEVFSAKTDVTFFSLSEETIRSYIATEEPFDKAGGYGIQGFGSVLVKEICGDYCNVVGLPLNRCARVLERFGVTGTVRFDGENGNNEKTF